MSHADETLITISDPDHDRYARLRLMENYHQDVISAAKVMVVGAGALGNEVLKNLALLGVGQIVIVDFDTIEISNLTRSILFRQTDRGRAKVEVAAERVREINPDVRGIPLRGDITFDIGLGLFRAMDLVIGCLDNRAARMAVNRACWRVGIPWIDGALNVADGQVRVFIPPDGACYECLMTKRDYELTNVHYTCPPGTVIEGVAITTPMSASIIGAMQVQEAIKLLHDVPVQGGQGVTYSAETLRTTPIVYPRRDTCPAHGTIEQIIGLPQGVSELTVGGLLDRAGEHVDGKPLLIPPDKMVTYFYCPACDTSEKVYRPYRLTVPGAVPCPDCSTERIFDVTTAISRSEHTRDIPLIQVGIAPYDIVTVRAGARMTFFELSGDRARILGNA